MLYCAEHPAPGFSDRLSAGRYDEVGRVIRSTVRAVYSDNGGQPDPEASTRILDQAHRYFEKVGFRVSDKGTWDRLTPTPAALAPDFEWSDAETELIRSSIVPVLKTDLDTAQAATRHFLRFVQGNAGREISRDSLPTILRDHDVNIRKSKKKSDFIKTLLNNEWLVISKQHTWFRRNSGLRGTARQYEVGPRLSHKFTKDIPNIPVPPDTDQVP